MGCAACLERRRDLARGGEGAGGAGPRVRADRWAHALSAAGADATATDGNTDALRRNEHAARAVVGGTCRRPLPLPSGVKPPRSKIHARMGIPSGTVFSRTDGTTVRVKEEALDRNMRCACTTESGRNYGWTTSL
ncbi:hypothetical protein HPB50_004724 [Hyalomma asiaticum]|uniref:Uncharacterized protein n=1 Tax=Hyalomma asiaticum TaxID=266040 RepID=A0ACB7SZ10_HYAAI|nr:hypothetical protein HPB50_004724 [Hyalomma asiaticum]